MDAHHVLVVDDERASREAIAAILRSGGIEVTVASGGEEALRLLESRKPELIVADVRMPGMSGYELCRRVRSLGHDDIPFFFCSTLGGLPERVAGLKVGADEYLVKPVDGEELLLKARGHLRRSRTLNALRRAFGEASEAGALLSGQVGEAGVAEVLQILDQRGEGDRCVRIDGPGGHSEIYVSGRTLVHAAHGRTEGWKAFVRALGRSEGTFRVDARSYLGPPTLEGALDHRLLEAMTELDEYRLVAANLGGSRFAVRYRAELFGRRLGPQTIALLGLVEKHGELDRIAEESPLPDLELLRLLVSLLNTGDIRPVATGQAAAPPPTPSPAASAPPPAAGEAQAQWAEAMAELRAEYVAEAPGRLTGLQERLDRLAAAPDDAALLHELRAGFHGLAGSGTTYGFPRVSALGAEGERICLGGHRGRPVSAERLAHLRAIVDELRRELRSDGDPGPEPEAPTAPALVDVVLADGHPAQAEALERALAEEGLACRWARSAAELRALVEARMPDAVLMDVAVPGGSGYELVRWTRDQPLGDRPTIFVTGGASAFLDKVEAVLSGADGYAERPFDVPAFVRRLRRLLEARRPAPVRVLVVEDDPAQAAFLRKVLATAGYEVTLCGDPARFEQDLAAAAPDVVLLDVLLPTVDGYALARFLRQDERYATLPILFVTTEGTLSSRVEAERVGADDLLVKPVVPWLLLTKIASRVERARLLKALLNHDGLTQLLTHSALVDRVRGALARAAREPWRQQALVMIDVDHFKAVNDRHGHPVGDRVLAALASLLRRRLRESDVVGRYGGEEFGILIEDLAAPDVVRLLERLREEFAALPLGPGAGGASFHATFSAGVAMLDPSRMDLDDWRKAADAALYRAKNGGRNRVVLADLPGGVPPPRA